MANSGSVIISVAYVGFLVVYGIIKGGRVRSLRDFSGKSAQPTLVIIAASMCASFIGGGFSLGNAERAFSSGIANTLLLLGFSMGQLCVGLFLAPRFTKFDGISTVGGIIGRAYGVSARILCGLLSAVFCTGVLGAQINAIGSVAGYMFSLPPKLCSFIGFAVILVYSTLGGLRASLKSDTIQIAVLGVGLPLALFAALRAAGGIPQLIAGLPEGHILPRGKFGVLEFFSIFLTFAFGEMLCPPSVQRMLLSDNPRRIRGATILSGIISLPFFVVTGMIGLCALFLGTTGTPSFAMPSLINSVIGFPLGAIICAAMLCVYLSSGGAFLNSCASSLCDDVIGVVRKKKSDDRAQLRRMRIINIACGCAAFVAAISFDDVLSILVLSYSFWAPVILLPLMLTLFGKRCKPSAFMGASAIAAAALIAWRMLGQPFGVSPIIIGLIANLLAYMFVFIMPKT